MFVQNQTAATFQPPQTIGLCPKSGDIQKLNNRTVVSVNKTEVGARDAARFESNPTIHYYDGHFFVTVSDNPKGYVCSWNRCYC